MTDVVGEDDEEFCDVEWLAGAEEDVGEDGVEERVCVTTGAVEEEDSVVGVAGCVAVGLAEGEVVQLELGESFPGSEAEVIDGVGAVLGGPLGWGGL